MQGFSTREREYLRLLKEVRRPDRIEMQRRIKEAELLKRLIKDGEIDRLFERVRRSRRAAMVTVGDIRIAKTVKSDAGKRGWPSNWTLAHHAVAYSEHAAIAVHDNKKVLGLRTAGSSLTHTVGEVATMQWALQSLLRRERHIRILPHLRAHSTHIKC